MPTDAPTWEDTVDAPSWEDTKPLESDFRRDELAKQTFEARIEGERAKLGTALATAGGNAAYWVADALAKVDPTGLSANILARQGVQRTPPILAPEDIDTVTEVLKKGLRIPETAPAEGKLGEVTRGLSEAGKEMAIGFSDPGMISGLGLAKKLPQEGARLFQLQMTGGLPSTVDQAMQAQNLEEAVKGGVGVAANVAFPIALGKAAVGKVPLEVSTSAPLRLRETRPGAIPPRGEPVAAIERVTPEQAALATERMSKGFEDTPKFEEATPLDLKPADVAPEKLDVQAGEKAVVEPATPPTTPTVSAPAAREPWEMTTTAAERQKALSGKYPERPYGETESEFVQRMGDRAFHEVTIADAERLRAYQYLAGGEKRSALNQSPYSTSEGMRKFHKAEVEQALKDGKYVPPEVLADYPDLKPAEPKTESPVAAEPTPPTAPKGEIVPMGGDVLGANAPTTPMQSAIKNAAVDRDRVDRGEPPMMDALKKGDPELWSQAMNVIDQDWAAADKLIARHKANPFIPSDVETMVLLHRRVDLKNEFNKANREAALAEQEGRGDAAEAAKAVRDSMGEKLLELEQVMGKGDTAMGTMAGRAFRARQLVMNEDFTMAELVPNREAFLGRKLTDLERAQLQAISDANTKANAELQARVEKLQAERDAIDAKRIIAEAEARIKRELPYHPRILDLAEGYAKKWDERGAQALADLKALFGGGEKPMFAGAPISPEMLDKAIIYGTSKIVRGAVDFAKWSDTMIRDLGPGFKDHAKAVWEASQKAFNSDVAAAFKKQGAATVQKVKGALKADLGTQTILKKIQRKVEESKGVLPDLKYYFDKLLDFHVRRGLKEEGPLLDAIHADAIKVIPDLTRRETREILAGYGTPLKPLAKDTVSVIKRDMHGQWQEISKIDMIQRGIFPPKLQERATMTDKQRWLRKQYEEQKRLHPEVTPTDVEGQLKTALQAAKTRITNQITDLEHQIQTRTKIVRESKRLKPDAELERLTAIRDEMRAVYDTVFKKPELTDAQRLEIWKERTRDRIEELTEKVKNRQFQPRKKPDPVKMDKEAQRLRFELHKVHRALLDLRYNDQMSKRNAAAKAFDAVANTVWFQRAMMTTGEFSGVLRQGGALSYQNPTIALRNLKPMMEAFKSEQNQFRIMEEILTRDNAPLYEKYGLEFTEAGTRLSSMEEHFMFRLSENMQKQPGLKQLVGTVNKFQRAYTVFLNRMRADVFDAMADTWGKDPATLDQIANAINVFSGRGSKGVGKFLGSGQFANTIAFAPKYAISRIQMLALQPMWRGNLHTRKMIAWQYLKMLRGPAALYALGALMGGKVNTDSNSSDFGKMVVGKTRIDPWMGILQPLVLFSRLGTGKKTTAGGREVPIRGKVPYGGDNAWDVIANFGRGKLSPSVGSAVSVLSGEDPTGQQFDIGDALKTTFYPMTYRDIIKLYGEHGIPEATAMATLGVFGVGVNTYDNKKQKTSQPNW